MTDRRAPGIEKRTLEHRSYLGMTEYEHKRISGMRAMQTKPNGGYRIPTNIWSGYGISHTSPGALNIEKHKQGFEKVKNRLSKYLYLIQNVSRKENV